MLKGECWNLLYTDELTPEQSDVGWRCSLCLDDPPRRFLSLEQPRIAHLFDPFGAWCSEKLRSALGISYYGNSGITSAKLGPPENGAVHSQIIERPRGAA
ncbi:MAG: hypothetical protein EOO38_08210 [Cytophagaceae bacterium]|nr:MAG: hypothetical protein EOO38_08210 [Cytophagaceae bacterium]